MAAVALPPQLSRWWARKADAERRATVVVLALASATLAWLGAWQPLSRDVAAMRAAQPRDAAALVEARRMVGEIAGLARGGAALPATDPSADLERVLTTQGLRGLATQIDVADGRLRVVFNAVAFDTLMRSLEALQRDARLRLIDATLTARVDPGTVRAELTLAR